MRKYKDLPVSIKHILENTKDIAIISLFTKNIESKKDFKKRMKIAKSYIENINILPTHKEILQMFPNENIVNITDNRDIEEIERRRKKQTCQPLKNELYSVNPSFNGIYSDPENR